MYPANYTQVGLAGHGAFGLANDGARWKLRPGLARLGKARPDGLTGQRVSRRDRADPAGSAAATSAGWSAGSSAPAAPRAARAWWAHRRRRRVAAEARTAGRRAAGTAGCGRQRRAG